MKIESQSIPPHDYINFKNMSGNEILLNLDNFDNLRNGELVGGLCELANRDKEQEFDWNTHPVTAKCINDLKKRINQLNSSQVIMTALLMQRLRIIDQEAWIIASRSALKLLHKFNGSQLSQLMDLFDQDILDDEGEPHILRKTSDDFFERIVGIIPVHIKRLSRESVTRLLEVLVKRNIGSEKLFRDYLLLNIEKNIMKTSVTQYARTLRALADKQWVDDIIFWNQFILKWIHETEKGTPRKYTPEEARTVWDSLVYLKLKCPSLDLQQHIKKVQSFIAKEEVFDSSVRLNDVGMSM